MKCKFITCDKLYIVEIYPFQQGGLKVSNRNITAQVSEREVEYLDHLVANGYYCSRSDAIRAFVRHCIKESMREGLVFE